MNNELMKALDQFYNKYPDLIKKNLSNEEEINQYGDILTAITENGYYNQLYEGESPIPKNKKEINIRRESLVSIFKNRAKLLLDTFIDKQMNLVNKEFKIEPEYCGDLRFVVYNDITDKMEFLKSLDFYFEYNLTNSMLCDLTNQACSYVYNKLIENLKYNSEISPDTILQITNCYGKIFWGTLIQLNREAHDYYYNMGIPDFQEPKKLN